jgi:hypothetical protein
MMKVIFEQGLARERRHTLDKAESHYMQILRDARIGHVLQAAPRNLTLPSSSRWRESCNLKCGEIPIFCSFLMETLGLGIASSSFQYSRCVGALLSPGVVVTTDRCLNVH